MGGWGVYWVWTCSSLRKVPRSILSPVPHPILLYLTTRKNFLNDQKYKMERNVKKQKLKRKRKGSGELRGRTTGELVENRRNKGQAIKRKGTNPNQKQMCYGL